MKVGIEPDAFLTKLSQREGLSYADALRGYVIESLLCRIYESEYGEFLLLQNTQAIGIDNYGKKQEVSLLFYYIASHKYIAPEKVIPGVVWSEAFRQKLQKDLFEGEDACRISWSTNGCMDIQGRGLIDSTIWNIQAIYQEMKIPITVRITPLIDKELTSEQIELELATQEEKRIIINAYAEENHLAESFFEIMKMLELISDMSAYDNVNRILKTETINGRHIMEMLQDLIQKEPKILRKKRIEQVAGYHEYTYMRKRWEQYEKRHDMTPEPWKDVLERILRFGEPIWQALCDNEVFFDDWMPELSRFLG